MQQEPAANASAEAAPGLTPLSTNAQKRMAAAQGRAQSKKDKKERDPVQFRADAAEQQRKRRARVAAEKAAAAAIAAARQRQRKQMAWLNWKSLPHRQHQLCRTVCCRHLRR